MLGVRDNGLLGTELWTVDMAAYPYWSEADTDPEVGYLYVTNVRLQNKVRTFQEKENVCQIIK